MPQLIYRTIQAHGHEIRQFSPDDGQSWHMCHFPLGRPFEPLPTIVLNEPFPKPQERKMGIIKNRALLIRRRGKRKIIRPGEDSALRDKVKHENIVAALRSMYPNPKGVPPLKGPLFVRKDDNDQPLYTEPVFEDLEFLNP